MTAYDSRARRWDERMRDVDQSEGDPKALPVAQTYIETVESQYISHTSKLELVKDAAELFTHNLPFPPRMRSQFVQFGVTPNDFREALFLLVWQLRETGNLPITGEREELSTLIVDIEVEMKSGSPIPLGERKRHSVVDKRLYVQLYDVPLESPRGQPSGRVRALINPVGALTPIERDPKNQELLNSVQNLLNQNKMDPFARHDGSHSSRNTMFAKK
ncbi:hypothetical protein D3C71_77880 [compost metagenome]